MRKILFIVLLVPINILAMTYTNSFDYGNKFTNDLETRNLYLIEKANNYGIKSNGIYSDNNFINYGYINEYEFKVIGGKDSYIYKSKEFYTMTKEENKVKFITSNTKTNIDLIEINNERNIDIRTTHYIKEKTQVIGSGTYKDPWIFKK